MSVEELEEVDLNLNEIVSLASKNKLSEVFGRNGIDKNIPVKKIKSQLTGTYDNCTGESRCDFNTEGIKSIIGDDYNVYTKPKTAPDGLRYYLYIEKRKEGNK